MFCLPHQSLPAMRFLSLEFDRHRFRSPAAESAIKHHRKFSQTFEAANVRSLGMESLNLVAPPRGPPKSEVL